MKPDDELLELMKGLHIPVYGDINYERKVLNTRKGNLVDPVELYVE